MRYTITITTRAHDTFKFNCVDYEIADGVLSARLSEGLSPAKWKAFPLCFLAEITADEIIA
jgi:hypothetical protein